MTWTARPTITSITVDEDGNSLIRALAESDTTVTYANTELASVYSNSEGEIIDVEVTIAVRGPVSQNVGDVLSITGHFTNEAAKTKQAA